jgi:hypothetical protein
MTDFAFQLDQKKVFHDFSARNEDEAKILKRSFQLLQMSADQPLTCISSSKWVLLAAHPARATFISELSKAQEKPLHE